MRFLPEVKEVFASYGIHTEVYGKPTGSKKSRCNCTNNGSYVDGEVREAFLYIVIGNFLKESSGAIKT